MIKGIVGFVKKSILRVMKSDDQYNKIALLESKISCLNKLVMDLYPDHYLIDTPLRNLINDFLVKRKIDNNIELRIHKHDIMFSYNFKLYKGNYNDTFIEYLNSGVHQMEIIQKILEKKEKDINQTKILDFASGHGRLTRFMVLKIPPSNIWVSDTKVDAVNFQKSIFNVNGFYSSFVPEELRLQLKFDFIFVGSLFSHLNQNLFIRWLKKLLSLLESDGVLCISTVPIDDIQKSGDFNYTEYPASVLDEEMYEISKSTGMKAQELYGVALVREEWLAKTLNTLTGGIAKYYRYKKALWDLQDIYIITYGSKPYYSDIKFEKYVYT